MFLGCYELWMLRFWMLRILDATVLDALIVSQIILDLNSLLLILQNTLVRIYPSPRTCEKLDFLYF